MYNQNDRGNVPHDRNQTETLRCGCQHTKILIPIHFLTISFTHSERDMHLNERLNTAHKPVEKRRARACCAAISLEHQMLSWEKTFFFRNVQWCLQCSHAYNYCFHSRSLYLWLQQKPPTSIMEEAMFCALYIDTNTLMLATWICLYRIEYMYNIKQKPSCSGFVNSIVTEYAKKQIQIHLPHKSHEFPLHGTSPLGIAVKSLVQKKCLCLCLCVIL